LLSLAVIIIASCSKDSKNKSQTNNTNNIPAANPPSGALIELNGIDSSGATPFNFSMKYSYDANGDFGLLAGSGGQYSGTVQFTYTSTTMTVNSMLGAGLTFSKYGNLDSKGRLTQLFDDAADYQSYQYSSDGYLTTSEIYEANVLTYSFTYTWSNGNLVTVNQTDHGVVGKPEIYTYYNNQPAIPGVDIALGSALPLFGGWPVIFNSSLLGKQSTNLIAGNGFSVNALNVFSYVFSNGKPVTIFTDDNQILNLTYAP